MPRIQTGSPSSNERPSSRSSASALGTSSPVAVVWRWSPARPASARPALARHFCDGCRDEARVLWGACDALHTPRPLGPLLDVAATTGGRLEDVVEAGDKPHAVFAALVEELAARRPTIAVLEDVHWTDEATLDLIRYSPSGGGSGACRCCWS